MNDETLLKLLGRVVDNINAAREAIARGKRDAADTNITCAHSLIDWIELRRHTPDRAVPTAEPSPVLQPTNPDV